MLVHTRVNNVRAVLRGTRGRHGVSAITE